MDDKRHIQPSLPSGRQPPAQTAASLDLHTCLQRDKSAALSGAEPTARLGDVVAVLGEAAVPFVTSRKRRTLQEARKEGGGEVKQQRQR